MDNIFGPFYEGKFISIFYFVALIFYTMAYNSCHHICYKWRIETPLSIGNCLLKYIVFSSTLAIAHFLFVDDVVLFGLGTLENGDALKLLLISLQQPLVW